MMPKQQNNEMIMIRAYTSGYVIYAVDMIGGVEQPGTILAALSNKDDVCVWVKDNILDADY